MTEYVGLGANPINLTHDEEGVILGNDYNAFLHIDVVKYEGDIRALRVTLTSRIDTAFSVTTDIWGVDKNQLNELIAKLNKIRSLL
jgi:hypothetical protein